MATKIKKKLCWNCEGRVGFDEEHCPFCGVYLSPTVTNDHDDDDDGYDDEQSPRSPYDVGGHSSEDDVPPSPFDEQEHHSHTGDEAPAKTVLASNEELRKVITPMGLLLAGSIFFLFGLVLLLFAKDGKFTLQWNSEYWYIYFVASLGMLFWGWRSLQVVDD